MTHTGEPPEDGGGVTHRRGTVNRAGPPNRRGIALLLVLLAVLGGVRLVFPGDIPFIGDEPIIISRALDANDAGTLVSAGLRGTRGATYGPAPTWIYQVALTATSDLRAVAAVRIIAVSLLTGLAIVLLARTLPSLTPSLGAFAFLSPYLWFYSRDLWDNSFGIPFSAMTLAVYAAYLRSDRLAWLACTALFATLCLLTHFMTAPLIGAVALHFVLTRWRKVLRSRRLALGVAALSAACLAVAFPYLTQVSGGAVTDLALVPSPASLAFSLDGFRVLSLVGFEYVIGDWGLGGAGYAMQLVSAFSYVAGAYGLYLCVRRAGETDASIDRDMARLLLAVLALFVLIANGKRLSEHPHYYSGVWSAFFCFWWLGMTALLEKAWARRVLFAQVGVMAVFLVGVGAWLHVNHGTKSLHYGPTLANQMAVARELDRLGVEDAPPSPAHHPRLFPQGIRVLRRLNERSGGVVVHASPPVTGYEIVYVDPDGRSGQIMVREVAAGGSGTAGGGASGSSERAPGGSFPARGQLVGPGGS